MQVPAATLLQVHQAKAANPPSVPETLFLADEHRRAHCCLILAAEESEITHVADSLLQTLTLPCY